MAAFAGNQDFGKLFLLTAIIYCVLNIYEEDDRANKLPPNSRQVP